MIEQRQGVIGRKTRIGLGLLVVLGLWLAVSSTSALRSCGVSAAGEQSGSVLLNPNDPFWSQPATEKVRVKFETSKGVFTIEATRSWAPRGVDRFYNLTRAGFFDDSRFFRVRAGFIAQFGIPGDPKVTAVWKDRSIADDPRKESNVRGTVAYAMTGPDTRTTQIYINLADNSRLDAQGFAVIGRIVDGMEVVDQLYSGYGEESGGGMRGGKQQELLNGGNRYLDREFPKLDKLIRAQVGAH